MPRRKTQQHFDFLEKVPSGFGGVLLKNSHAKGRRPFSSKHAIHLVMRSSLAKGDFSMRHPKHTKEIDSIVRAQALRHGVRLYRFANSGNHLHLLVRTARPFLLKRFLRAIAGLIPRLILKTQRGKPLPKGVNFWDQRPFSRLVTWGQEYTTVARYLLRNTLEALGFIPYWRPETRRKRLRVSSG